MRLPKRRAALDVHKNAFHDDDGVVHQHAQGVSLDAQKEKILAWAQANDYELLELFVDAGLSGSRADNRPGLQRAVSTACKRKAALVVYSLSRLARSTKDALVLAERLNKAGADLVSLTESIDTTSASGKMIYRLLSVLNEFQRDLIAEHTAEALAFKARNRQRFSRFAPFGYRFDGEGCIMRNEREQSIIALARQLRKKGLSMRQISKELGSNGMFNRNGKPLSAKAVFNVLSRAA